MYIGMYYDEVDAHKPVRYVTDENPMICIEKLIALYHRHNPKHPTSSMSRNLILSGTYYESQCVLLNVQKIKIESEK